MTGLGTTLTFKKTSGAAVPIANIKSISELAPKVEEIDETTLDSAGGYREFIAGFKDSGELNIRGIHTEDVGQKVTRTAFNDGEKGEFVLTFPDKTTFTFNGFFKGYAVGGVTVDGSIEFGATIRISGPVVEGKAD